MGAVMKTSVTTFESKIYRVLGICSVIAVVCVAPPTVAQTAADGENEETQTGLLALEEIVVTGTSSQGVRKLDASFAITTKTLEEIQNTSPLSTADIFRIAPGVFVESTGGESGANAYVRGFPTGGDAPFIQMLVDGVPIYADNFLAFMACAK